MMRQLSAGRARVCYVRGVFTGLVQAVGTLAARQRRGDGARLEVVAPFEKLALGESINVMGVCLTVAALSPRGFEADASVETLAKTTLGGLPIGSPLDLERALRLEDRLGGHIVSGHVDGVGSLVSRAPLGEAEELVFQAPTELMRSIAAKGSIAVDGVSLTVNAVEGDRFTVAVIPRTREETTLGRLAPRSAVNLEIDVLARYVLRALDPSVGGDRMLELLRKNGYV
jgi:riboflavin synthase